VRFAEHKGIALLITVFFVMLISVALGISLKYVKKSTQSLSRENFLLQVSVITEDILTILKTYPELNQVTDGDSLFIFLSHAAVIPLHANNLEINIQMKSARGKINPNVFTTKKRLSALNVFMLQHAVNEEYSLMIKDSISRIKADNMYNTDIFSENPYLFRDYIASDEQLMNLNRLYKQKYHENSLDKLAIFDLFYTSPDTNSSVDVNYATPLVWELLLHCDESRAENLSLNGQGLYTKLEDLGLSDDEKVSLSKFPISYYKPIVDVEVSINDKHNSTIIRFEYDIKLKKGTHFVVKI